jgi:hypothetical protein
MDVIERKIISPIKEGENETFNNIDNNNNNVDGIDYDNDTIDGNDNDIKETNNNNKKTISPYGIPKLNLMK